MKFTSNADAVARRVAQWSDNVGPSLAKATLQAATVLTEAGKREAPSRSGRLRRSIGYVAGGQLRYIVSPRVPYAIHVHRGTGLYGPKQKRIAPGKIMAWTDRGAKRFAWSTKGQKPNPFMKRALDRSEARLRQIAATAGASIVTTRG